ncbi:hypothetical protein MNEG_6887 [Monoraphidium neglectum]|uniref:Uncharacterized protein n=1 Tax=Monoraphidium neglectum TaxID=145388 RepID=A0A0D2JPM5_9CHLO|nr:hypothetical protein MNEG_6887 [Monoraphidium neglectum]KIZ01073.1 hypothetical protein MNEG_6887 [Monoraphidium neglectum]|eukprot:XP_013900092.1 hypothetical protein MNEG_6887 [Monoraphidium neglectum]
MLAARGTAAGVAVQRPARGAVRVFAAGDEGARRGNLRGRFSRRPRADGDKPDFKDFLPLPKPAHLVYIKPTVAVVTDVASRSSVGIKMTIGDK